MNQIECLRANEMKSQRRVRICIFFIIFICFTTLNIDCSFHNGVIKHLTISRKGKSNKIIINHIQMKYLQKAKYLTSKYPNNYKFYQRLGQVLVRLKLYNDAVSEFKTALYLSPKDSESYIDLGIAYFKESKFGDAIINFRKSILLESKYKYHKWLLPSAYYWLGLCYGIQKKYHEKYNAWRIMTTLNLSHRQKCIACNDMGNLCFELKNFKESKLWYMKSISIYSHQWFAYIQIGIILCINHKLIQGNQYFEMASKNAKTHTEHMRALFFEGKVAQDMNNQHKSLKLYNLALKHNANNDTKFYMQIQNEIKIINSKVVAK